MWYIIIRATMSRPPPAVVRVKTTISRQYVPTLTVDSGVNVNDSPPALVPDLPPGIVEVFLAVTLMTFIAS